VGREKTFGEIRNQKEEPVTEKKNETALVTGGGGFLGKALIRQLLLKGNVVRSFSRGAYPELDDLGAIHLQGDICDPIAVERACEGVDIVYHTAAKAGVWGKYEDYYTTNVLGTQNVIAACRNNNVRRLICTSSASVIYTGKDMEGGDESLPYPARYMTHYPETKAMAERLIVQASDNRLKTMVLRPHLIWGPEDHHLVPRIIERAKKLLIIGNGKNIADTIYIDNAVDAHVLAGEKLIEKPDLSGKIYFISQEEYIPVWTMINRILEAAGCRPIKRRIPAPLAWIAGAVLEGVYRVLNIEKEPQLTRFVVRELSTSHWYDISAVKKDLGFKPRVSVDEGMKRLSDWFSTKISSEVVERKMP
jgi:2-alkyl-3-oxoalkanoate reductase